MKDFFNRMLCRLFRHKRGKRVGEATDIVTGKRNYYCPRCKATWTRKVKA